MNYENNILFNQEYYNEDYNIKDVNKLLIIFNEKESEHNWEKFNNALKQFRDISVQLISSHNYYDILKSFSGAILNSINSERGALSKTALEVIGDIAHLMKFNFEPFIDIFIPSIINITGKTNNIFTQNGLSCIKKIIANTNSTKIIPQLNSQKSNKKKKIRLVVAESIETCLHNLPDKKLTEYVDTIGQLIKEGIYDREQIIRDTYKRVYLTFKNSFNNSVIQRFESKLSKEDIKRLGVDINSNNNVGNFNSNSVNILKSQDSIILKTPKVENKKPIINPSIVTSEKKNSLNIFNVPSTPSLLRQENPYFQQTYSSLKKSLFFNRIPNVTDQTHTNSSKNLLNFFLKSSDEYKSSSFTSIKNNESSNLTNNKNNSSNDSNDNNDSNNKEETFVNTNSPKTKLDDDSEIIKSGETTILEDNNQENIEEIFKNLLKQISSLDTIDKDKAFESLLEAVTNCNLYDIIQNQGYILECIKFGFIEDNHQIILQSLSCLEKIIHCKKQLQEKKDDAVLQDNNESTIVHREIIIDNSIMSRLALILSDFKNNNVIINKALELMENIFKDDPLEEYISTLLDKALEYDIKIKKILIDFVEKLILYTYSKTENRQELSIDKDNKLILNNEKENKIKEKFNPYLLALTKKINEADPKQRINLILSFINILQVYPFKTNLVRFLQIYINFSNEIHIRRRLQHFAVILCRDNTINNNPRNSTATSIMYENATNEDIIKIPNCIILFEAIYSLPPSQRKQIKFILSKDIPNLDDIERNQKQLKAKLNALKQKNEKKIIAQEPGSLINLEKPENQNQKQKQIQNLYANKLTHSTKLENNHLTRKIPSIKSQHHHTLETKVSIKQIEDNNKPKTIINKINTNNKVNTISNNKDNMNNKNIKTSSQSNSDKIDKHKSHSTSNNKSIKNDINTETKQSISKIPEYSYKTSTTIKKQTPRPSSSLSTKSKLEFNNSISKIPRSSKDHHLISNEKDNNINITENELIEKFEKLEFLPTIRDSSKTEDCHKNLLIIYEIISHFDQNKMNLNKINELIDNLLEILSDPQNKVK
ncbi:hypothetical protein BCR36DRAFT_398745 [Piromyces finnis]|uniref:CLASP N-terminal domain-containing protein n=1 Tax=Piromyces finnis TaxID=1754191 RepID=A0A1Y1V5T9_9FUNG|nr:hypothetical protein BCR36DRAFT_398745 [Piromyces finnis]|eukprot:ORX46648.1 hypothetical protein BCR36DRAFT_398745 [Piromyces finnis]